MVIGLIWGSLLGQCIEWAYFLGVANIQIFFEGRLFLIFQIYLFIYLFFIYFFFLFFFFLGGGGVDKQWIS